MGVLHMEKEEILKQSRNENKKGDELEKNKEEKVEFNRYFTMGTAFVIIYLLTITGAIRGTIFVFQKAIDIKDLYGLLIILSCTVATWSKFYYSRKKRYLLYLLFFGLGLVIGIYRIFIE